MPHGTELWTIPRMGGSMTKPNDTILAPNIHGDCMAIARSARFTNSRIEATTIHTICTTSVSTPNIRWYERDTLAGAGTNFRVTVCFSAAPDARAAPPADEHSCDT